VRQDQMTARTESPSDADLWKDIARQLYVALSNRKCQCVQVSEYPAPFCERIVTHQCMRCAAKERYEAQAPMAAQDSKDP